MSWDINTGWNTESGAMVPMAKGISVIGSGIRAAQCALTLAEMGIDVALITPSPSLDLDNVNNPAEPSHELLACLAFATEGCQPSAGKTIYQFSG